MNTETAERYLPRIMMDRAEPFEIKGIGYTVFHAPARSRSFRRDVYFDPQRVAFAVEYAVYFDFDIQHLYDLEHIWIYVGHDGAVVDAEASFHGFYLKAMALEGYEIVDQTHLKIFCQPGKHAFMQEGSLFKILPDWQLCCNLLAGSEGLLVMDLFEGRIATNDETQAVVEAYIKTNYSFNPTLEFEYRPLDTKLLLPWESLFEAIPPRITAILATIKQKEGDHK